ncbi:hypothetical protein Tco_0286277 [Tanacetum coccineum]
MDKYIRHDVSSSPPWGPENKLQRKSYELGHDHQIVLQTNMRRRKLLQSDLEGPTFNLVKDFHKNNVFLRFQMDECYKLLTNKVDLVNPEGHQILRNIYEPLPVRRTTVPSDREAVRSKMRRSQWIRVKVRQNDQRKLTRLNELHKFSDETLTRVMEKLDHMVKDFHLFEYNKGMEIRKWSEDDKRRSKDFITTIEKRLQIRRIFQSLESFVGGRIRDIDYRLINKTT